MIKDNGLGNTIELGDEVKFGPRFEFVVDGNNNCIKIEEGSHLRSGRVHIRTNGNKLWFGRKCMFNGGIVFVDGQGELVFGDGTTVMGARISFHENGRISFGRDCMLSSEIRMDVSDMHSILDKNTNKRINPPADINIGAHVWIGYGVFVTNGVSIGDNCIIGAKSLVSNDIPPNCLAVGIPARVTRTDVTWDRRRLPIE